MSIVFITFPKNIPLAQKCKRYINYIIILCRKHKNKYQSLIISIQIIYNVVNYALLMHYPTKNDVFIYRTFKKTIQQIGNIPHNHFLGSSVIGKGFASRHRSPSRNTLLNRTSFNLQPTAVFPTPIVPQIK